MKVGFFDSGFGGITILKEAINKLGSNIEYVYLADNLNVPYGIKTNKELKKIIINNIQLLIDNKCEIIVIACNTATAVCIKELREKFNIKIIGTEPALKPAIEFIENKKAYALEKNTNKKVLVTATNLTLKNEKLISLIEKLNCKDKISCIALPKLVEFAESNNYTKEEVSKYLNNEIKNKEEYDAIVLGCTHFPLFKQEILECFDNKVEIFDSSCGVVDNLIKSINEYCVNNKILNNQCTNNVFEDEIKLLLTKENQVYRNKFISILNRCNN